MQARHHGAMPRQRGFTLLECLVFAAIWTMLAVGTMRVIGESRVLRARARDRATMTLIAQNELELARLLPPEQLVAGMVERTNSDWPSGVKATCELSRRSDGTWLVDIIVTRESVEGRPKVRLTTVRSGAAP